jgi:hypothetical protein
LLFEVIHSTPIHLFIFWLAAFTIAFISPMCTASVHAKQMEDSAYPPSPLHECFPRINRCHSGCNHDECDRFLFALVWYHMRRFFPAEGLQIRFRWSIPRGPPDVHTCLLGHQSSVNSIPLTQTGSFWV